MQNLYIQKGLIIMNYIFKSPSQIIMFSICLLAMIHIISFTKTQLYSTISLEHESLMSMDINNLEKLAQIFPKSAEEINKRTAETITLARKEIDEMLSVQNPTFENTIRAFDISADKFSISLSLMSTLSNVHPDQKTREAALSAKKELLKLAIDLYSLNEDLYHLIQNYYDNYYKKEQHSTADDLLITEYLKASKRSGLHLPKNKLEEVKKITKEITVMEQDFRTTINNDDTKITATKEELAGVNESFLSKLEKNGDLYIIPCKLSTYIPVITECTVSATRKKIFFARNNIVYPQNETALIALLKKRQELATLLEYESFAALDLQKTSAKTIDAIENFLTPLAESCRKKALQEINDLSKNLPQDIQLQADSSFNQWDYPYVYSEYNKKNFSIDESAISEYFPVEKVMEGIFTIYQNFLGLTFKQVTPKWSWHEDVMLIEIYRQSSQELLGYLFLDLYPRANKFSHACVHPIIASFNNEGKNNTSVAVLITNSPKPSADAPALLQYSDAVTFFHEFGHAMHNVLSRTQHPGQAGLNVAVDFVETPSQMFEQWMFEEKMLPLLTAHYKTGETLPKEIIEKKIALRKSNSGYQLLRQCMIGLFALRSMSNTDLSYNPSELWKNLHETYATSITKYEDNNHWFTTFGHLASDLYASKYYSYLWTEVFALDLFSEIKKNDFNAEYSQKVVDLLSAGGSVDSEVLLEQFLGRKPNQEAFLKILGLE